MSKSNQAQPGFVQDIASATLTTSTTTGTITPSFGSSYQVVITVSAVTGTSPTLDFEIQESRDNGTVWVPVYDFPRITATGQFTSPIMTMSGSLVRYVQTVAGTTPSFTRAVFRDQGNIATVTLVRQIIDRTITLTTLNSNTVNLVVDQGTRNLQMTINIGAVTTTAPVLQVMASDDAGASWYSVPGTSLTTVANSTVSVTISGVTAQLYRVVVTTTGVGVTAGYVLLRAY